MRSQTQNLIDLVVIKLCLNQHFFLVATKTTAYKRQNPVVLILAMQT